MICPKCGEKNNGKAKFCKSCGTALDVPSVKAENNQTDNHKKIIIGLIIIIIAILAIGGLYGMGVFKGTTPLESKDFGAFAIDVPEGSDFVISESLTTNPEKGGILYLNKGKYQNEVGLLFIGVNLGETVPEDSKLIETNGNKKIYQSNEADSVGVGYTLQIDDGNCHFEIVGYDLDTVKRMADTFEIKDLGKLTSDTSSSASQTTGSSSKTPSSISILGGSFTTGSAESDKTYARINVGTSHAGEDVIVQIFYSRDGNSLNHGNMVPATVHSDGYLEIASADAYHYYPDYATIKIYDSNSKLLTTQSVSLSPQAGTQTF